MLPVRLVTAFAKPLIVGGAVAATASGVFFAVDRSRDKDASRFAALQGHGQRLVVSQFSEQTDNIVAIDPRNPDVGRTEMATIDHAPGFGVFPTLSPDGKAIAYTALPPGTKTAAADSPAQAAVIGVDGKATVLADDVDLLIAPVWSPDSSSIVLRKNTPTEASAGSFELILVGRDGSRATLTEWSRAAVFPIAFSPDGARLYFATLSPGGSDLYSIGRDGSSETKLAHLSDGVAREWRLSPDGATIAFTVAVGAPASRSVGMTADLATGSVSRISSSSAGDEVSPAWRGGGAVTFSHVKPAGGGEAVVVDAGGVASTVTDSATSIDLPLSWSPDSTTLAVRAINGRSLAEAGVAHVELIGPDGRRQRISDGADVLIAGWLQ